MVRIRLMVVLASLAAVQAGCAETAERLRRTDTPYSARTATSYDRGVLRPGAPAHPDVQAYLERLNALEEGRQAEAEGVPLRPIRVSVLPPDIVDEAQADSRPGLLDAGAPRRRVTVPAIPPLATPAVEAPTPPPPEPAPSPEPHAPPDAPARDPMSLDADAVAALVATVQSRAAANPSNLDLQLQLRLLLTAVGRDGDALEPIPGLSGEENARVAELLQIIMALRDQPQLARTPEEANARLAALEYFQEQLRAVADLQIPTVRLCKQVDGYGVYVPFESTTFQAGQTQPVIVYCEVRNFSAEADETGMYRTRLNLQLALYNEAGELAQPAQVNNDIEDVSANRRHDFFLRGVYFLRSDLPPGQYTLKVTVEDPRANKVRTESIGITLAPPR